MPFESILNKINFHQDPLLELIGNFHQPLDLMGIVARDPFGTCVTLSSEQIRIRGAFLGKADF